MVLSETKNALVIKICQRYCLLTVWNSDLFSICFFRRLDFFFRATLLKFRATWLRFRATWLRARWLSGDLTVNLRLTLPRPGFDSRTWCHAWVEFLVGSLPCSAGFFSRSSDFLLPQRPTFLIPIQPGNGGQEEPSRGKPTAKLFNPIIIVILLFLYVPFFRLLCSQHQLLLLSFKFLNFYTDSSLLYLCCFVIIIIIIIIIITFISALLAMC